MPTEAEALDALRQRVRATQDAAQRLADEAAREAAGRRGTTPPAGWDVPRRASEAHSELDALVTLLATLRDALPPELRTQLAEVARQLLVLLRAVIDWSIGRLERAGEQPPAEPVEDIPIS